MTGCMERRSVRFLDAPCQEWRTLRLDVTTLCIDLARRVPRLSQANTTYYLPVAEFIAHCGTRIAVESANPFLRDDASRTWGLSHRRFRQTDHPCSSFASASPQPDRSLDVSRCVSALFRDLRVAVLPRSPVLSSWERGSELFRALVRCSRGDGKTSEGLRNALRMPGLVVG